MAIQTERAALAEAVERALDMGGFRPSVSWPTSEHCRVQATSRATSEAVFCVNLTLGEARQVVGIVRPGEETRQGQPLEWVGREPARPVPGRSFEVGYDDRRGRSRCMEAVKAEMDMSYVHLLPPENALASSIEGIIEAFPDEAAGMISRAVAAHATPDAVSRISRSLDATPPRRRP